MLLAALSANAQVDTKFWFVAPEVAAGHGDNPIFLRLSSFDEAATITISQPANPGFAVITQNLTANNTVSVNLTAFINVIENKPENTVLNFGLLIESTAPITAYYEVSANLNPDIFALKGNNALGTDFYLPIQNFFSVGDIFGSPSPRVGFDIVATMNNTDITITPTTALTGHPAGVPFTISLNAGQTYSLLSASQVAPLFPAGTRVISTSPIAITIKHDSMGLQSCFDLIGDQIVPLEIIGMEYIVMKGFLSSEERIFVTATEDNTEIMVGGVLIATINTGQQYSHLLTTTSAYVQTNKPAYVFHISGFGCEMGGALLPSIRCTGSQSVRFTRSTGDFFGLNIMVRNGNQSNFTLNGSATLVPASSFVVVPNTNNEWVAAQISFTTVQIPVGSNAVLTNSSTDDPLFHLGIINGNNSSGCRYGYFSDFGQEIELGADITKCVEDEVLLDAGPGQDTYQWNTGETTQSITIADAGTYYVITTKDGCEASDTISIADFDIPVVEIEGLLAACAGQDTELNAGDGFETYQWSTGDTTPTISAGVGEYWVLITDANTCEGSDTVSVVAIDLPLVQISGILAACAGGTTTLSANEGYAAYLWSTGSTEAITVAGVGTHTVQVTDDEGCQNSATAVVLPVIPFADFSFDPSPIFGTGKPTQFTDLSATVDTIPAVSWIWTFGDGNGSAEQNPIHNYAEAGVYPVTLTIIDAFGCTAFITYDYTVIGNLEVPNVISPNGDGVNDFFVVGNLEEYPPAALSIWNRWGNLVFEANPYLNNWNGDDQSAGVYFYLLKLKNGALFKGNITLIRD
jgi:gliding motility-associated-like protein